MRWGKVLLGGGAAVGAAAVFNALARRDGDALDGAAGGEPLAFRWRAHEVAFTVQGEGPPVVLVHGVHAAASSWEWRRAARGLARRYTVYAPDLLGFGRSDRPAIKYSPRLYLSLLADFVDDVVGGPAVLAGSGLGAAYCVALGARDPARYPALVLSCPTGAQRPVEAATGADVRRLALGSPVLGTAIFNAMVSRRALRRWLELAYHDNSLVDDAMVDWHHRTAHQPGARFAPAALVAGQLDLDVRQAVRRLTQPVLAVWGEQAAITPAEHARGFASLNAGIDTVILGPAGDLPHDERPRDWLNVVGEFLRRVERA